MKLLLRFTLLGLVVTLVVLGGVQWAQSVTSQANAQPTRQKQILVTFTQYQWWLSRWQDNQFLCSVVIEHDGIPTYLEVLANCGQTLYKQWIATPPCPDAAMGAGTTNCPGLYLHYMGSGPGERIMIVELPLPTVKLSLNGCIPTPPQNKCDQIPALVFIGEEPLPNEQIISVHIRIDNNFYDCPGFTCQILLQPTSLTGIEVEFYARSSYGDETSRYKARVRVLDGGISDETQQPSWLVDVISTQWQNVDYGSCAVTWESFPPVGTPPHWLTTPDTVEELASNTPFVFLAGQLISMRVVDASMCEQDGLLSNGAANMCGLQEARLQVNDWQDYFDERILETAKEKNIPAFLLKNLFAQESQFWPGEIIKDEFGLGQITELGADATLLWNLSFFAEFCPLVYHQETCAKGYAQLTKDQQAVLRGALATRTNANCPSCEQGIDLHHAVNTVDIFAETLLANCEQVSYLVYDVTKRSPGSVSTYEDLWRYTLVNYNAGPGCLQAALQGAYRNERVLNWQTVSSNITAGCQTANVYVERVTRERTSGSPLFFETPLPTAGTGVPATPGATPAPTSPGGGYPVVTPVPQPTQIGYPIFTPTPQPTQIGYP